MSRLGVDTGGTFTDFVWLDETGRLQVYKTLSTPTDPSAAILQGIATHALSAQMPLVHGSTVATNALLERRGARTGLVTTAGFEDVLAIGRQNRPDIYALVPQKPPPLVARELRLGVEERVGADGRVVVPLNASSVTAVAEALAAADVESVAICLLFSFLDATHEEAIAAALRQRLGPDVVLSLSSQILPEFREYERTATTVINAYVAPLMQRYLTQLADGVAPRPLAVMQSNGGIISAATAGREAARTCLSGPAGGVVGAAYVAAAAGFPDIITFDMGGTSTDVALVAGKLPTTTEGSIAGLPLRLPIIDIHTVGAGGGSLATIDAGGALHVGPQSAGALPGPAAYDRGGSQATTTDANLVTGRLDPDNFLGGAMRLNEAAAAAALSNLAQAAGAPTPAAAAWGVLQVANATMERAIRRISVERGHDPRRFTLVPFGGAGPLHACELAERLQIPRVLIPATPGVLSALGMLVAAPTKDVSLTVRQPLVRDGHDDAALLSRFEPLLAQATAAMVADGYDADSLQLARRVDMRYVGQSHELSIPLPAMPDATTLQARLDAAHQQRFGYAQTAAAEVVTLRVTVTATVEAPTLPQLETGAAVAGAAVVGSKAVWFDNRPVVTTLYDRTRLQPGMQFAGPAVVFQYDTTTVIPPLWHVEVDSYTNLVLTYTPSGS